jgi:hypothetical protein
MMQRPGLRRMLVIDFTYWFAFAIFQTTFALFVARRFGFDAPKTGYFFAAFGVLGVIVQGGVIRPIVHRLGDKPTFIAGLVFSAIGLGGDLRAFGHAAGRGAGCRWRWHGHWPIRRSRMSWSRADRRGRGEAGGAGAMSLRACSDRSGAMRPSRRFGDDAISAPAASPLRSC